MTTWVIVAIVVVAVLVVLALVAALMRMQQQKKQSEQLREGFGPEYDRVVGDSGDRRSGESELLARKKRVEKLHLRDVSPEQRQDMLAKWQSTQAQFVDDPTGAVTAGHSLVEDAMRARGFPVGDFDQRVADISVEHPYVVEHYRAARDISRRNDAGDATTDDLRDGMIHYRELFNELLNTGQPAGMQQEQAQEPVSRRAAS